MNYDDLLQLVKERRSIRRFTSTSIPDDYINKIIDAARWAPSCKNSQPWEFVVVKDKETRNRINEIFNNYYASQGREAPAGPSLAQVFVILCSDPASKPPAELGRQADSMFYSSLGNAFLYMVLAVTTLGLGAQWISASANTYVEPQIKELLGIPSSWEIFDTLALGFPDIEPKERQVRDLEVMIHTEHF